MSPLLGSTGLVSYYSYRGNIDTLPDVFSIGANVTDVEISAEITRTVASVTGINYKAKVTPSSGATISVNGSGYTSTAQYVRNGQSVSIKYTPADYETDYTVSLTIGKRSASYTIRTRQRPEDGIPNAFDFNQPSGEIDPPFKTNIESNIVTLSGMSNVPSGQTPRTYDIGTASISGNSAQFRVTRGGTVVRDYSSSSYQVLNGDQIQLRMNAGGNAQTVSTTFSVTGTDTTNLASPTTATVSDTWSLTSKNYVASITLSARPTTVDYNESTTISWTSQNIKLPITITNVGDMYNTLGSRSSYKLNKGVNGGDVTFTATAETLYSPPSSVPSNTVTVHVNPPPAPIVTRFTADSYSLSFNSGTTTLRWSTSNASSINSNFGETVANGEKTVGPLTQTTTYTISANGLEGQTSSTSSLTITVPEEPAIEKHITSNTTNVNASSYFGGDWGRNVRKKLYIDPGVVVGSTDPNTAALIISSGVVGAFTLINNGSIQGAPGAAGAANGGNGGKGGNAIRADASATIENNGSVVAGGGGGGGGTQGGSGGNGGSGSYTTSTYVSQSCPSYDPQCPTWFSNCTNSNLDLTTRNIFCALYYAGCPSYYDCSYYTYSEPIATTGGTGGSGGNGGAGGIGQGYNQGSTVGSSGLIGANGSLGGTNAGNGGNGAYGGNGGNGGNYGLAGSPGNQGGTGAPGSSGNVSGGTGGQAASASVGQGGASGYSLNGTNYTSLGGYFEGPQKSNP